MTTILQDLRNAVKFQIRALTYQKLLTAPQARELTKTAERGHTTTLQNLFQSLRKVKSKSTLAKIRSGTAEPKKTRKEMSDLVAWRLNRPLFGKTKIGYEREQSGNIAVRSINIMSALKLESKITKAKEEKLKKYGKLLHVDVSKTYEALYKNNNIRSGKLFLLILYADEFTHTVEQISYSKDAIDFDADTNINTLSIKIKRTATSDRSGYKFYVIGYRVIYKNRTNNIELNKIDEMNLKAFHASNDIKYHNLTIKATHDNHICIYESFEIVNNIKITSRTYTREQRLKREGDEISKNVIDGNLLQSLSLLNIKYDKEAYIVFYNDVNIIIHINNKGEYEYVSKISDDQHIYLYDKVKQHVAPSIYNKVKQTKKDEKKESVYNLMPAKELKKKIDTNKIINNTIAFDFETFVDTNNNAVPYCCSVFGMLEYKPISSTFYGLDCTAQFIKFLDKYTILLNHNKHKQSQAINYINIYGFNNANFDNIFIHAELFKKDNNTEILYNNGSFKKIKYNNLRFYDLKLIYGSGSLRSICKDLNFEKEKGLFPYSFINVDNINYIGAKPDLEYYDDITIDEYNNINNVFNVKDETSKYCLLDTELTYLLAVDHIKNNTGFINGKYYNTLGCVTVGSIAKKLYNQCFQKDVLFGSTGEILQAEKDAYFGGRCSIFKKSFESIANDDKLYAYDINASYVNEMTHMMPYKIIRNYNMEKTFNINNVDIIEDVYLYYISGYNYIGNDDNVINNLVETDENGETQSYKNYNKNTVHWGIELRAAILNGFNINVYKIVEYSEKPVFADFATYCYSQRLINKDTNISKSKYFKAVGNNLYGKFAQKQNNKSKLVNNFSDIFDILDDDMNNLVNFTPMTGTMGFLEYKDEENVNYSSLTRFSSYISARAKVALHNAFLDVGFSHVYYTDTDSLYTTKQLSPSFVDNTKLGKFKLEAIITKAVFYSPKNYSVITNDNNKIVKSKGIKSNLITDDDLLNLENNKAVSKQHTIFKKSLEGVKIVKQNFTLDTKHKKILEN
jgi:hypothetical protein